MSRYVNLDEKIKAMYYDEEHEEWNLKEETIESALNHVDYYNVFELIRCKDCKHREERLHLGGTTVFCLIYERYMGIREYCGKAERKKE